jgi:hypothetical protein
MVAMIKAALQGWLAVAVGVLLALITLFSSYNHVEIPGIGNVGLNHRVGVFLRATRIAHEQRMKQLQRENKRLAELDAKLAAIGSPSSTSSSPQQTTPDSSAT